jgi:pSer/pThr/pTyr-binding forkhead associated (FHA) protein
MLARFERLMEDAVEGSLRRVFPTTIQPVQLAKAAARAMEEAQLIGLHGAEVPNSYRLRLAPADLERFADYRVTLARELNAYLVEYAQDRGLRPIAEPRVELVEDRAVRAGSVRAEARFVDLAPARESEIEAAVAGTRRLRLADLASARPSQVPQPPAIERALVLTDRDGLRFALEPTMGVVRVGRATDNEIAIDNQRVSRYHAQLRWVESSWLVYDLDSTNGTFVDGERLSPSKPRVVGPKSQLRLGDHDVDVVQDVVRNASEPAEPRPAQATEG